MPLRRTKQPTASKALSSASKRRCILTHLGELDRAVRSSADRLNSVANAARRRTLVSSIVASRDVQ